MSALDHPLLVSMIWTVKFWRSTWACPCAFNLTVMFILSLLGSEIYVHFQWDVIQCASLTFSLYLSFLMLLTLYIPFIVWINVKVHFTARFFLNINCWLWLDFLRRHLGVCVSLVSGDLGWTIIQLMWTSHVLMFF